ncbi:MAG: PIN domain-containing protein [Thermodesulfobacteriota bacterium]|nr:PIN domain-containing protein [Thermodesulfobacteriota bacterium]
MLLWIFVLTGAVVIVPASITSLATAKNLMEKFADLPMDFADATIVALAHDLAINRIVTFDKKHFSIYRLFKSQSFQVIL